MGLYGNRVIIVQAGEVPLADRALSPAAVPLESPIGPAADKLGTDQEDNAQDPGDPDEIGAALPVVTSSADRPRVEPERVEPPSRGDVLRAAAGIVVTSEVEQLPVGDDPAEDPADDGNTAELLTTKGPASHYDEDPAGPAADEWADNAAEEGGDEEDAGDQRPEEADGVAAASAYNSASPNHQPVAPGTGSLAARAAVTIRDRIQEQPGHPAAVDGIPGKKSDGGGAEPLVAGVDNAEEHSRPSDITAITIQRAATHGYSIVGRKKQVKPETVHRMRACMGVAEEMVEYLARDGHQAGIAIRGSLSVVTHGYVLLADGRIGDPTWQQFLGAKPPPPDAPEVLFGTRDEVIAQARRHGIDDPHTLALWRE